LNKKKSAKNPGKNSPQKAQKKFRKKKFSELAKKKADDKVRKHQLDLMKNNRRNPLGCW
jgi:hypothetical protein